MTKASHLFTARWDAAFRVLVLAALGFVAPTARPEGSQQAYLKAFNNSAGIQFGCRLAVSGDTIVVGAPLESSLATGVNSNPADFGSAFATGAAYVFVRQGTNWVQQAYLKASNTGYNDRFGSSVAISGDTVVIGAPDESSNASGVNGDGSNNNLMYSGAAYVFVRSGTNWSQQAYLKASNPGFADLFGYSVAVSGDTIVVGAWQEDSSATGVNGLQNNNNATESGAAYVFVRNGTNWSQQAYLKASNTDGGDTINPSHGDHFGFSVGISGDTVVVGANGERSSTTGANGNQSDNSAPFAGAGYVFVRNETSWTQQAYLKASNTRSYQYFGEHVAISGDTVVATAYGESSAATGVNGDQTNNTASYSGAAYIFVRNGTNWSQQAYLKASNTQPGDYFGRESVAASGDTIVVGSNAESSNATGINGDQSNNHALGSGAAYVFVRSGNNWTQQAYLKASNTGTGDFFGWSVGVSGDTVVVGAVDEDSNAMGVNGDQNNENASDSGGAYVFAGLGVGARLALNSDGSGGYFVRFTGAPEVTCRLQRAPSITGPWDTLTNLTAYSTGLLEYHDTLPLPGQAFYRTVQP